VNLVIVMMEMLAQSICVKIKSVLMALAIVAPFAEALFHVVIFQK
jgi:hypothetical protein